MSFKSRDLTVKLFASEGGGGDCGGDTPTPKPDCGACTPTRPDCGGCSYTPDRDVDCTDTQCQDTQREYDCTDTQCHHDTQREYDCTDTQCHHDTQRDYHVCTDTQCHQDTQRDARSDTPSGSLSLLRRQLQEILGGAVR